MMPLMAIRTMRMAVCHLVSGSGTDSDDFDVEVEGFAGQRMLRVDDDFVAFDGDAPDRRVLVVGTFGHEGHARFDFHVGWESLARDGVGLFVFVALAVA